MEQEQLFYFGREDAADYKEKSEGLKPLAERMRPASLDEYAGQKHLLKQGGLLRTLIEKDTIPSMIFWGPPGSGKTTLATIIAKQTKSRFLTFSAVTTGVKEIKEVMSRAQMDRKLGNRTIVFIDEIHRFNKLQQDAFLPYVENGSIVLIGATTENPSFEVNSALLSRCRTFVLKALETEDIEELIERAIRDERGYGHTPLHYPENFISALAEYAAGDARLALNALEMIVNSSQELEDGIHIEKDIIAQVLGERYILYDKKGDAHYDLISALHKSMRNSDVQASIYWLTRMLEGGEDPLYIARRIVRMASEDIGMADSRALEIAVAAYQACMYLGMPECSVHLIHAITYLALAPKSNAIETAYFAARDDVKKTLREPVPLHIRNAPTSLMKDLGYGKDYEYSHDFQYHMTDMECLPPSLKNARYYVPGDQGSEVKVGKRMEQIDAIKQHVRMEKQAKKERSS